MGDTPACLEPDEIGPYLAGRIGGCGDCTIPFSTEMARAGRCNGAPDPEEDDYVDRPLPIRVIAESGSITYQTVTSNAATLSPVSPTMRIPCPECLHEPVCALKTTLNVSLAALDIPTLGDGISLRSVAIAVDCAHFVDAAEYGRFVARQEQARERGRAMQAARRAKAETS